MQSVTLTSEELRKLLSCGLSDAVALYLYRASGAPLETALDSLHFTVPRMVAATDCLRQLALWAPKAPPRTEPERPVYTEADVRRATTDRGGAFSKLVGEAQRRLGRTLSTEELKTLLSFLDYLRLPTEVVGLLLSYCMERSRRREQRAPSMRTIEKEAYRWADEGIDTLEAASYYVQTQLALQSRVQQLRLALQIDQRRLTPAEEQYLTAWLSMGFSEEAICLAYEKTCLNTGGLKWNYMNSIIKSWHTQGLHTPQEIRQGDKKRAAAPQGRQSSLSPLAKRAVQRTLNANGKDGSDGIQ